MPKPTSWQGVWAAIPFVVPLLCANPIGHRVPATLEICQIPGNPGNPGNVHKIAMKMQHAVRVRCDAMHSALLSL